MITLLRQTDFYRVSWSKYQSVVKSLENELHKFCIENNVCIDCAVPILRGGGVLAVSLAHSLKFNQMYPVQYKYDYSDGVYCPKLLMNSISLIDNKDKARTILVTEGNHCTGQTAQLCINLIKSSLRNANVIYVSVGRDYSFRQALSGTVFEATGFYTNESKTLTQKQCDDLGIKNKYAVYPWENLSEEMDEVNNHNTSLEGNDD